MTHPDRSRSPARRHRHRPATTLAWLVSLALLMLATPSSGQDRIHRAAAGDALDAQAAVPALRHAGSLASYRRLGGAEPLDWAEANASVGRIGGWRAYAREAARPAPAASTGSPAATPTTPAAAAHRHRH